ncbi:MAG: DUF6261 family protein [Prevotellaceae bacterium]|jgi:hypothetical protein|nr:DUF6261 family protein [Prevotellaceae bacterium]
MKIKAIIFSYLRNEAHLEFLLVFRSLLERFPDARALVEMLCAPFAQLLALEQKLVDAARASNFTQLLADVDHRVDRDIAAIKAAIRSAQHHFDPAVAEAARELHDRMKSFGDIKAKAYEEESAAVQRLLADLQGPLVQQTRLVNVAEWVAELANAEAEFVSLFAQRNTELADRPQENLRDVRRQIEEAYHKITACIDTDLILHGEEKCGELARQLNEEVRYFNEHSHHHAKHDLHHAAVDSIADQPFAGKAVTPIPTVRYTDSKGEALELTFAKDFTLTYKDNDRVGTAEVIIHGKGAYKGQKVVTFSIV